MKSNAVVIRKEVNHHITVVGDPRPYQPIQATQVPDGGPGWAFVVAAALIMGIATAYRHFRNHAGKSVASAS